MYTMRQVVSPSLGKEAEVRSHLTDWGKHLQGKGHNLALLQSLFSAEGPALVVLRRADDLNALEKIRRENQSDSDWQSRSAKLSGLLRLPVRVLLAETVIEMSGDGPVGVVRRAFAFPSPGKEQQARSIAEESVKASQAAGVRSQLAQRLFSWAGPVIELSSVFADLAALDRNRLERGAPMRETVRSLHELSREPIQVRLFEVLLPYPS